MKEVTRLTALPLKWIFVGALRHVCCFVSVGNVWNQMFFKDIVCFKSHFPC